MEIKQFRYSSDNLAYLLFAQTEALVVDGGAVDAILDFLDARQLNLRFVSSRLGADLLDAARAMREGRTRFRIPILVLHGSADRVAAPDGMRELRGRGAVSSFEFDGLHHEVLNEPERDMILALVLRWLELRLVF